MSGTTRPRMRLIGDDCDRNTENDADVMADHSKFQRMEKDAEVEERDFRLQGKTAEHSSRASVENCCWGLQGDPCWYHAPLSKLPSHRLQNLSCPLRGASGRSNGRGRAALSRSSGRHQGQTRGRTRRGSRTAGSSVRARVGGVSAQLGGHERVARERGDGENLLGGQRGEELSSTTGGARAALQGEAVQEDRWQRGVDAHRVLPRPCNIPTRTST